MLETKISSESWHHRLATTYAPLNKYDVRHGVDFCRYFRNVLFGLMTVFLIVVMGSLFLSLFLMQPIIYAISLFDIGLHAPDVFSVFTISVDIIVAVVFYVCWKKDKGENIFPQSWKIAKIAKPVVPSFVELAYRKFKEKTCFMIYSD